MSDPTRRQGLQMGLGMGLGLLCGLTTGVPQALALSPKALQFPRDFGAHPELRTEWWYLTGRVSTLAATPRSFGFQVTFFRSRVDAAQRMTSRLAARQLLFAHAALTDVAGQNQLHDQRMARWNGTEFSGAAHAALNDTAVALNGWSLKREVGVGPHTSRYAARVNASGFGLDLQCATTQPVLLQGQQGLSRKGPDAAQASFYYSQPQLATTGHITLGQQRLQVQGTAWLDHEWSEALLHPDAVGWDWLGMNLANGSALTVFRLRRADGSALWAGGSWRSAGGDVRTFAPSDVTMTPLRHWDSPRTGTRYPVAWRVQTPVGEWTVRPLLDAQELDSRATTGAIYWEGLSELHSPQGEVVGHGYLELTGYGQRMAF